MIEACIISIMLEGKPFPMRYVIPGCVRSPDIACALIPIPPTSEAIAACVDTKTHKIIFRGKAVRIQET